MKKRIHILTVRDHFKMMVEPGVQWYKYTHSWRFRERFFVSILQGLGSPDAAPESTAYQWLALDCEGVDHYGKPVVYFTSGEAAEEWCAEGNKLHPIPPKPDAPPPPFPLGTYDMLEAGYYEVRQIVKPGKGSTSQLFIADMWDQPYELVSGWYGGQDREYRWEEKFIAKYDDREQALAHLRRLIHGNNTTL